MPPRPPEPPDFAASQLFLRRLAYSLVRDEARAEDLVQETWATWVERRPQGLAEPRAWLARVLRNRAFNLKRTDERRARREELAGRPDPSAPDTDGTLEAQAQLLEALRKLEEPYRSTLVQRYYHDLSPSAIAERAGTPLNTVKARLARGLEKLRAEMDRRYHGDRRAWCHWLTVLGAPPVPVRVPGAPGGAAPAAGATSGGAILAWCGVAAALVAAGVWRSGWRSEPRAPVPPVVTPEPEPPAMEPRIGRSESPRPQVADEPRVERESASETEASMAALGYGELDVRAAGPVRERFDWPQYGGGASHDHYREREDEIHAPRVVWFVPGCAGQPTLEGDDLYTGGLTVARLDPETGEPRGVSFELLSEAMGVKIDPRGMDEGALFELVEKAKTFDPNDPSHHTVAAAPLITGELVLARHARDGSVTAFDRELGRVVWRWDSGSGTSDEPWTRLPLSLADDGMVLVVRGHQLIALKVAYGHEVWRFPVNGRIERVPAAAEGRVFLGTDRGLFVALDSGSGERLWQAGSGGFGASAPMTARDLVLVAPGRPWESQPFARRRLLAYDCRSGREVWEAPFEGQAVSALGLGPRGRHVVAAFDGEFALVDLRSGKRDPRSTIRIGSELAGAPTVVGEHLVVAGRDGRLAVHELEQDKRLRWAFQLPDGARIHDFVHTGRHLYVATSIGLFCLGDDPRQAAPAEGFVLEWSGDPRQPSYRSEK